MSWLDYITGSREDTANAAIMGVLNNGGSADQIANIGRYYTDQGYYNNLGNDLGIGTDAFGGLAGTTDSIKDIAGNFMGEDGSLLGITPAGMKNIGLAYSMYDTMFGTGSDIRDAQLAGLNANVDLLKQKLASNKEALANQRTFNKNWANASNAVMGGGLAGSAVR